MPGRRLRDFHALAQFPYYYYCPAQVCYHKADAYNQDTNLPECRFWRGRWGWEDNDALGLGSPRLAAGRGNPPRWRCPKAAVLQLHLGSSVKQEAAPKFLLEVGARGKSCLTKDGWMPCVGGGPGAHQLQPPPSGGQCGPQEPWVGYRSLVVGRACINSVLGKGREG